MIRIFPLIFVLLWSSAFITTKPIIDNSDPFAALAFRFFFVAVGFCLFSVYSNQSIVVNVSGRGDKDINTVASIEGIEL